MIKVELIFCPPCQHVWMKQVQKKHYQCSRCMKRTGLVHAAVSIKQFLKHVQS